MKRKRGAKWWGDREREELVSNNNFAT